MLLPADNTPKEGSMPLPHFLTDPRWMAARLTLAVLAAGIAAIHAVARIADPSAVDTVPMLGFEQRLGAGIAFLGVAIAAVALYSTWFDDTEKPSPALRQYQRNIAVEYRLCALTGLLTAAAAALGGAGFPANLETGLAIVLGAVTITNAIALVQSMVRETLARTFLVGPAKPDDNADNDSAAEQRRNGEAKASRESDDDTTARASGYQHGNS